MSLDVEVTEDLGNVRWLWARLITSLSSQRKSQRLLLPSHLVYNLKIALVFPLSFIFILILDILCCSHFWNSHLSLGFSPISSNLPQKEILKLYVLFQIRFFNFTCYIFTFLCVGIINAFVLRWSLLFHNNISLLTHYFLF